MDISAMFGKKEKESAVSLC